MTIPILRSRLLERASLLHGFTTRQGGVSKGSFASLNLSTDCGDEPFSVKENRVLLCAEAGFRDESLCLMKQVHDTDVHHFEQVRSRRPAADIAITRESGLVLIVQTADCVPILIYDPVRGANAAIHGGWRGVAAGVVQKGIEAMRVAFDSKARDLIAVIGPRIDRCCFEVGEEVLEALHLSPNSSHVSAVSPEKGRSPTHSSSAGDKGDDAKAAHIRSYTKWHLDLAGVVQDQLISDGITASKIDRLPYCTSCSPDLFFSHRRDQGVTGRQWSFIQLAI